MKKKKKQKVTVKFSPFFQEGIHFQLFFHTQVKVFLFVLSDLVFFFFFFLFNLTVVYPRPFLFFKFPFFDNGNHPDTFCDVGSFFIFMRFFISLNLYYHFRYLQLHFCLCQVVIYLRGQYKRVSSYIHMKNISLVCPIVYFS